MFADLTSGQKQVDCQVASVVSQMRLRFACLPKNSSLFAILKGTVVDNEQVNLTD